MTRHRVEVGDWQQHVSLMSTRRWSTIAVAGPFRG
jgi:hypothetical protein